MCQVYFNQMIKNNRSIHIKLKDTFMMLCYLHFYIKLQYRIRKQKVGDIMNVAANSAVHYNKESRRLN